MRREGPYGEPECAGDGQVAPAEGETVHPEMLRAIAVEQMADRQAEAEARLRVRLARQASKGRRRGSRGDPLAGVRIPDYVDGAFHQDARPAGRTPGPDGAGSAAPAAAGGRGAAAGRDAA
jgi:hypothetical protein